MDSAKTTTAAVGSIETTDSQQKGIDIWFNNLAEKFERSRFATMALIITIQSCLGSIACMFVLQNNASDVQLILCAMITMACNSILIAQGPAKWCLSSFFLSVLINSILVLMNI